MDILNFTITGMEEVDGRLERFEKEVVSPSLTSICEMLVKRFKEYPEQKYVSRKEAFGGDGFFSDKQRRWFFAHLREGDFDQPYARSDRFKRSWFINSNSNTEKTITNTTPYGAYVMGSADDKTGQSRMQKKIGWKKVTEIMETMTDEIQDIFREFVDKWR